MISIKLSGAPFAFFTLIFLFIYFRKVISKKEQLIIFVLFLVMLIPHLIRGYYISGYPLFPIKIAHFFDPKWILSNENVDLHSGLISCWAKVSMLEGCENLTNLQWIESWVNKVPFEIMFYLLVSIILFFISLIKFNFRLNDKKFIYIIFKSINLVFESS